MAAMLCDVVVFRRRRWTHAPVIHAASHFYHEKRVAWVSISTHACDPVPVVMGLRLAALRAAGAPLWLMECLHWSVNRPVNQLWWVGIACPAFLDIFATVLSLQHEYYESERKVYLYFAVSHNSRYATSFPHETIATIANTERLRAR